MILNITKRRLYGTVWGAVFIAVTSVWLVPSPLNAASQVQTTSSGNAKVAPGEFLPVSVKLVNFGGSNRVDVVIYYKIIDAKGNAIYSAEETVAVETTASFVKSIQIPSGTAPGRYTARSSILYPDQVAPATSEFPFMVERKIFGLFQGKFYLYGGAVLVVAAIAGAVGRLWIRRRNKSRLGPIDYPDISKDQRVFYELISDTIMGMRQRVGEDAMDIAKRIPGLMIDAKTGRILQLTDRPSKIISELVSEYEKALGKKVSFSFRRT